MTYMMQIFLGLFLKFFSCIGEEIATVKPIWMIRTICKIIRVPDRPPCNSPAHPDDADHLQNKIRA